MPLSGSHDGDVDAALIKLAHGMRLKVIAEGVEVPAQMERLQALGCDELQGYLYGRPMEVNAASNFIFRSIGLDGVSLGTARSADHGTPGMA